jgi:hypothetical protein
VTEATSTLSSAGRRLFEVAGHRVVELPICGHSLTIDRGWQEVAQTSLDLVRTYGPTV